MSSKLRYMLLQVRNADDPMREQEVRCFSQALNCPSEQISVVDLINQKRGVLHLTRAMLDAVDMVMIGGSGDYSVAHGGPWLPPALETMAELAAISKPTFASCWGFQAMAQALGGKVIHNPANAELGTLPVTLNVHGKADSVFGRLLDDADSCSESDSFLAVMGHEDHVVELPDSAIHLASSQRVEFQAFRLKDKPIYATQFHPDLNTEALLERLKAYPRYVESYAGESYDTFAENLKPTPLAAKLLSIFVNDVFN